MESFDNKFKNNAFRLQNTGEASLYEKIALRLSEREQNNKVEEIIDCLLDCNSTDNLNEILNDPEKIRIINLLIKNCNKILLQAIPENNKKSLKILKIVKDLLGFITEQEEPSYNDFLLTNLNNYFSFYVGIKNYNLALENLKQALKSMDLSSNIVLQGLTYNNLCSIYLIKKIYDEAYKYAEKSLYILESYIFKQINEESSKGKLKNSNNFKNNLTLLLASYINFAFCLDVINNSQLLSKSIKITEKPSKIFYTNGLKLSKKYFGDNHKFTIKFENLLEGNKQLLKNKVNLTDEENQEKSIIFKENELDTDSQSKDFGNIFKKERKFRIRSKINENQYDNFDSEKSLKWKKYKTNSIPIKKEKQLFFSQNNFFKNQEAKNQLKELDIDNTLYDMEKMRKFYENENEKLKNQYQYLTQTSRNEQEFEFPFFKYNNNYSIKNTNQQNLSNFSSPINFNQNPLRNNYLNQYQNLEFKPPNINNVDNFNGYENEKFYNNYQNQNFQPNIINEQDEFNNKKRMSFENQNYKQENVNNSLISTQFFKKFDKNINFGNSPPPEINSETINNEILISENKEKKKQIEEMNNKQIELEKTISLIRKENEEILKSNKKKDIEYQELKTMIESIKKNLPQKQPVLKNNELSNPPFLKKNTIPKLDDPIDEFKPSKPFIEKEKKDQKAPITNNNENKFFEEIKPKTSFRLQNPEQKSKEQAKKTELNSSLNSDKSIMRESTQKVQFIDPPSEIPIKPKQNNKTPISNTNNLTNKKDFVGLKKIITKAESMEKIKLEQKDSIDFNEPATPCQLFKELYKDSKRGPIRRSAIFNDCVYEIGIEIEENGNIILGGINQTKNIKLTPEILSLDLFLEILKFIDIKEVISYDHPIKTINNIYDLSRVCILPFLGVSEKDENGQEKIQVWPKAHGILLNLITTKFFGQEFYIFVHYIYKNNFRIVLSDKESGKSLRVDLQIDHSSQKKVFDIIPPKNVIANEIEEILKNIYMQNNQDIENNKEINNIKNNNIKNQNPIEKSKEKESIFESPKILNLEIFLQFMESMLKELENFLKNQGITEIKKFIDDDSFKLIKIKVWNDFLKIRISMLKPKIGAQEFEIILKNCFETHGPNKTKVKSEGFTTYSFENFWKDFGVNYEKLDLNDKLMISNIILDMYNLQIFEKELDEDDYDRFDKNSIFQVPLEICGFTRIFIGDKYKIPITMSLIGLENEPVGIKFTIYDPEIMKENGVYFSVNSDYWKKIDTTIKKKTKYQTVSLIEGNFEILYFLRQKGFKLLLDSLNIEKIKDKYEIVPKYMKRFSFCDNFERIVFIEKTKGLFMK